MTAPDVMTAAEAAALADVEHGGLCHEDAVRALRSVVALHARAAEAWHAGAEAAREEAAETCDAWALLYHPTLRFVTATTLAARIRALPPAAPPPPREGAVRAPDGGGTGEGSPDAPEGATGALAGVVVAECWVCGLRSADLRDHRAHCGEFCAGGGCFGGEQAVHSDAWCPARGCNGGRP